jgi:hypothetical protein
MNDNINERNTFAKRYCKSTEPIDGLTTLSLLLFDVCLWYPIDSVINKVLIIETNDSQINKKSKQLCHNFY